MRGPVIAYDTMYDDRFHGNGFISLPGQHVSYEAGTFAGVAEQYGPLLANETACSVIEADDDYLLAGVFSAVSHSTTDTRALPDARYTAHALKGLFERPWPETTGEEVILGRLKTWLQRDLERHISVDYTSVESVLPAPSIAIVGLHPAERRLEIARCGDSFAVTFRRGGETELFANGPDDAPASQSLPMEGVRGVLLGTQGLVPQGFEIQNPDHRQRISNLLMYGGLKELMANCVVMANRNPGIHVNGKHRDHAAGVFLYL